MGASNRLLDPYIETVLADPGFVKRGPALVPVAWFSRCDNGVTVSCDIARMEDVDDCEEVGETM